MLSINGKKFMNLPEAVQWLLNNNALPFQSTANYVADTIIAKTTIVNPSPAEIRIGSLVLFADGKVGTVSGITANGFMVGPESTDLPDGVPHITNIQLDASNHLIFTMSEGSPIDAGLVKMVSSLTINASQHLVVNYNDGTSTDLGAIFQGNVNISGNLTADSIIENMTGYSFTPTSTTNATVEYLYAGVVKNGNKVTFCSFIKVTRTDVTPGGQLNLGTFTIPQSVADKLIPYRGEWLDAKKLYASNDYYQGVDLPALIIKPTGTYQVRLVAYLTDNLVLNTEYVIRFEATFLLSDNMAA